ncbi:MAG: ribosome-associated translation inhibitor RaiA [Sphingomonadales bacterium]|nr:MAG: ribosome-associated translation inhibitor RaiA [Sphingomonadales bacterium]
MDIRVSGRNIDLGDAFPAHARARLEEIADKYFSRSLRAQVTMSRDEGGTGFHAYCALHVRQGIMLKAEGNGGDARSAFDLASSRIEKQLRRYKRRLTNHHGNGVAEPDTLDLTPAAYVVFQSLDRESEDELPEAQSPVIVAEMPSDIPEVSVSDAVMLLDLRNTPALLFRNAANRRLSMVYRREDGNVAWVEPQDNPSA